MLSVGEPQTARCWTSLEEQTVAFNKISMVVGVSPLARAMNHVLSIVEYTQMVLVAADCILYPAAHEIMLKAAEFHGEFDRVYAHRFGLRDTFLDQRICCMRLWNATVAVNFPHPDTIRDDVDARNNARDAGFDEPDHVRTCAIVGTHFDDPDPFQVYRRFFVRGIKRANANGVDRRLRHRLNATGNSLYELALIALKHGRDIGPNGYNTSKDIEKDRELYRRFIEGPGAQTED